MSLPSFDISALRSAYLSGALSPFEVIDAVQARIGSDAHHAWIRVLEHEQLQAYAQALAGRDPATLPLYGVPFAIKDNIDLAGVPTTAACPAYTYTPGESALVVERLIAAGAIPIGKTNLDQFATGLNGTRSPFGACHNAFDTSRVSGGSSSGSAVAVALGQVSFALGTDTAGSGRIPAAFNHLVGLKPTCGLLSTWGIVPACRSLDAVSILGLTAEDCATVYAACVGFDARDAYSRAAQPHGFDFGAATQVVLGVPRRDQWLFLDSGDYALAFERAIEHARQLGAEIVEIDFEPFFEVARLLYGGPWVAERYQAIRDFIIADPDSLFPVTRAITLEGAKPLAADAFAAQYRLQALRAQTGVLWQRMDALLTPTAPFHPTIAAVLESPIERNTELGIYTNFVNLLDLAAVALPFDFLPAGVPFGVTVVAPAHQDMPLLRYASRWQRALDGRAATLGALGTPVPPAVPLAVAVRSGQIEIVVCGAHLLGEPLNYQLTERRARRVACTTTAPCYLLYALPGDGGAERPALVRTNQGGAAIEVEVWELHESELGRFVAQIPAPLGIGKTLLADGRSVPGFICEPSALAGATDITTYGGWRAWRARRR